MSADNWTECPKCGKDFREDYELGISRHGKFYVDYSGSCGTSRDIGCGLKIKYEIEKDIAEVLSC